MTPAERLQTQEIRLVEILHKAAVLKASDVHITAGSRTCGPNRRKDNTSDGISYSDSRNDAKTNLLGYVRKTQKAVGRKGAGGFFLWCEGCGQVPC